MQVLRGGKRNKQPESARPLISLVIVTYNAALLLEDCLLSIFSQSFTDFELIILDGRSTDSTLDILHRFDDKIEYWQSEPDNGIYDAMNRALDYCKGKWVLFLGADDRLLPGFADMARRLLHDDTIYYGDCVTPSEIYGGAFSSYQLAKRNICQQCVFYPYEVFNRYRFDTRYPVFADYLLNMQCWGDADFKKVYYSISIAQYNLDGFSSFGNDENFKRDKPIYVKKYLGWLVYFRYLLKKVKSKKRGDDKFF
jgi:glycosyltransferase involved in cell wall biosynthesis